MIIRNDLTGKIFGRLTVKEFAGKNKYGKSQWLCLCECGNTKILSYRSLVFDNITGCGCKLKPQHGLCDSKSYPCWIDMKSRCKRSPRHAGRGITVCDRWLHSFENFLEDMGERPEGLVLDRKDNNGNYEPDNCRWVTTKVNNSNRENTKFITYKGETLRLVEWASQLGINSRTLRDRIKNMSVEDAFNKPIGRWL